MTKNKLIDNIIQTNENIVKKNYLNETVAKICKLVEERGVAGYRYRSVIKQITDYLKTIVKNISPNKNHTSIEIPKEYTSKIDFIYNLDMTVFLIRHSENSKYESGSGKSAIDFNAKLVNGKLNDGYIEIEAYFENNILDAYTFEKTLYHEINHYYDMWQDLLKNNNINRFYSDAYKSVNFNKIRIFNNELDAILKTILYRLFSDTELNALISGVYGELSGKKSKRENFSNDLQSLTSYKIYKMIYASIKIINMLPNTHLLKIKRFMEDNGVVLYGYGNSITAFKEEFIRKIRWRLKNLLKGIGKVASLYYDDIERNSDNFKNKIMI